MNKWGLLLKFICNLIKFLQPVFPDWTRKVDFIYTVYITGNLRDVAQEPKIGK